MKQQKPVKEEQYPCFACGSFQIQLLLITYNKVSTILNLLCLDCGRLQVLNLGHGLDYDEIKTEKRMGDYLG